jgi:hypothetical protein
MTTVREVALPLATICAPVPRVGDGICDHCHRPPNHPYTWCWSCEQVEGQVSRPCSLIVPISLYEVGLQLHYQLKHYKDDDGSKMAWDFLVKTAALLGYFLKQHGGCISTAAGGAWDIITSSANPISCLTSTFAASANTASLASLASIPPQAG